MISFIWNHVLIGLLLLHTFGYATPKNKVIRIGGAFPLTVPGNGAINYEAGSIRLASFILAINDMRKKYISQNISIEFAIRNCRYTYTNGALAVIDLRSHVFEDKGVHGVIGVRSGAKLVSEDNVAQLIYDSKQANSDSLSHVGTTKFNAGRVLPSSSYQSFAMINLLNTYNWKRVIVLYAADDYGSDALNIFRLRANDSGIQIIKSIGIIPGDLKKRGLSQDKVINSLQSLQEYDARVFVLLLEDPKQAQQITMIGAKENIFTAASTLIGTSAISVPSLFEFEDSLSEEENSLMYDAFSGYLGIQHAFTDWMVSPTGLNFLDRFRALPPTRTIVDGKEVCSQATDDDGVFKLWNISTSAGRLCGGSDYSTYGFISPGYAESAGYAAWTYDSATALLEGIIGYCKGTFKVNDDFYVPDNIDGRAIIEYMVGNVTVPGVTGTIKFSKGNEKLGNYGYGDRTFSVRYQILNFNSSKKLVSEFELNRVGTWLSESGYQACSEDPTLQTNLTGGCTAINWGTLGNVQRSDRAAPRIQLMPQPYQDFLIALAVILAVSFVFMAGIFVKYRQSRLLKASQLPMLWLVLIPSLYAVARIISASYSIDSRDISVCVTRSWTGHLAFSCVIALFAKTLRVHLIVNAKFRKVKISTNNVLTFSIALMALGYGYWLIAYGLNLPYVVSKSLVSPITGQKTYRYKCNSGNLGVRFVLYAYEALILLLSLKVCYDTRNVPDAINESPAIAKVILIVSAIAVVIFVVVFVSELDPWANELLTGVGFFAAYAALMGYYFFPKAYALMSGSDLNARFQLVKKLKRDIKGEQTGKKKVYVESADDNHTEKIETVVDPFILSFCPKMPNSLEDSEKIMQHYRTHMMLLTQLKMGGSDGLSNSKSSDSSRGLNGVSVRNIHSNPTINASMKSAISRSNSNYDQSAPVPFKMAENMPKSNGDMMKLLGQGRDLAAEAKSDSINLADSPGPTGSVEIL